MFVRKSNKCFNIVCVKYEQMFKNVVDTNKHSVYTWSVKRKEWIEVMKAQKIRGILKTGIVIGLIYILFVLYLLFVSDRVEKLEKRSNDDPVYYSLKIGD